MSGVWGKPAKKNTVQ